MGAAGPLRERLTFQARTLDENGDPLGDWDAENGVTVWARAQALRGSEPVMQSRLQGVQPVQFTIRSSRATRAITSAWRAVWQGQPYNIRSIAPDEKREFIAMLAEHDQSDA